MQLGAVDGANWAQIITAFGTVGIALGIVFAGMQIRDDRAQRTAEIARQLAETWESPGMVQSRKLLRTHGTGTQASVDSLKLAVKRARRRGTEAYYAYTRFINFFEQLGLAFTDHSLGYKVVAAMFAGTILDSWSAWKEVIPFVWGEGSTVGENFGKLAKRLSEDASSHGRIRRFFLTPY